MLAGWTNNSCVREHQVRYNEGEYLPTFNQNSNRVPGEKSSHDSQHRNSWAMKASAPLPAPRPWACASNSHSNQPPCTRAAPTKTFLTDTRRSDPHAQEPRPRRRFSRARDARCSQVPHKKKRFKSVRRALYYTFPSSYFVQVRLSMHLCG